MKKTRTTPASEPAEDPKARQQAHNAESEGINWGEQGGATGFEGTRAEDLGIPFLVLLQKGSPEVDEDHPDYPTRQIDGAKSGMVINSLTREIVYDKGDDSSLLVIPVFHQRLWQEWRPRTQGGGFVQSHPSPVILTKTKRNDKNQDILPNGNEIKTTSYFSVLMLVDGNTDVNHEDESKRPARCIIPMTSTQLKKARTWLNMMQAIKIGGKTPPMYSHIYRLTTVPESNEKGNWQGWKVEIERVLTMSDLHLAETAKQLTGEMANNTKLLTAPPPEEHGGSEDQMPGDEDADAHAARRR